MPNTNKIHIDIPLVSQLIATQFPQWANLPIKLVNSSGWDNYTFHLGKHMSIRLPSSADYASQVQKEQLWLPKLAPFLPLQIPKPLAMGNPTQEYPWHWSIYEWLPGKPTSVEHIADLNQFAITLAKFLTIFHQIDTTDGPPAGSQNFFRGGPLSIYNNQTQEAIVSFEDKTRAAAMSLIWDTAISSSWEGLPVWVHGDIAIGNLLINKGQLSAVIDFGQLGIGDPACDLAIAWTLFTKESRRIFRTALPLDNATWERGRAWALWKTLCAPLPGTPGFEIRRIINEILSE